MPVQILLHIFFMSAAAALIVAAVLTAHRRNSRWLIRHRMLAVTGALSALVAFILMFTFKVEAEMPHFRSPHALAGLVIVLLLLCTPAVGALLVSGKAGLRPVHRIMGRIASIAVPLVAMAGVVRMLQLD
jgi:hypothetical protein